MEFQIERLTSFSEELVEKFNRLLSQLNKEVAILTKEDIEKILSSRDNFLLVARSADTKEIVGMTTLVIYRIPVVIKGWIEDVVVDEKYRHKGIATLLIRHAISSAKAEGLSSLNLTSRPIREKANQLYEHLGFEKRDTNVYQIKL